MDLKKLFAELGLPLGLVAVVAAVLSLIGIELDRILAIAGALVGVPFGISFLINVLKWAGVVNDGDAGKWSAGMNLVVLGLIVFALKAWPEFDFTSADAQIEEIVRFFVLVFGYVVQLTNTKKIHGAVAHGLGIKPFSYSIGQEG